MIVEIQATDNIGASREIINENFNDLQEQIDEGLVPDWWSGDDYLDWTKTWINFATKVRAVVLTGISFVTGTAITATDTVLTAFGKLQKQITDLIAVAVTLTWSQTLTNKTLTKPIINWSVVTSASGVDVSGTVTFDLASSDVQKFTLNGNKTLALTNASTDQIFAIRLLQDWTGSRTVTWFSTIKWSWGVAPTLTTTASKADMFVFVCTGSGTYDWFIVWQNI